MSRSTEKTPTTNGPLRSAAPAGGAEGNQNGSPKRRHNLAPRRGVALILALLAVAVAATLALSFLSAQGTSVGLARNLQNHAVARHVAESGLELAIAYVRSDADWRTNQSHGTWVSEEPFGPGTFTIVGEDGRDTDGDGSADGDGDLGDDPNDPLTLTVTGTVNGATHVVRAVITPQPVLGSLLMIVGEPASLTAGDLAKRSLLESWGWSVNLHDDGASQGAYDTASAANRVALVGESASPAAVGAKPLASTNGVVLEIVDLGDELGLTEDQDTVGTRNDIDILDNAHPITATLALGPLELFTANQTMHRQAQTIAPGATVLGLHPVGTKPSLYVVDVGGGLYGGGTAAGRRVQLPWGAGVDYSALTPDGATLMNQALAWAAQAGAGGGATTYDYAIRTPGTDAFAYNGESPATPSDSSTPAAELTAAEYDDLEIDDGVFHAYSVSANGSNALMRFVFVIDEAESDVAHVDVAWNGRNVNAKDQQADGVELYVWNFTSAGYEPLAVSPNTEAEVTLSATLASDLPDYVGGAGDDTLIFLVASAGRRVANQDNTLYTDFFSVGVTSGGGGGAGDGTQGYIYHVAWQERP